MQRTTSAPRGRLANRWPVAAFSSLLLIVAMLCAGCADVDPDEEVDETWDALTGAPKAKDAAKHLKDKRGDVVEVDQRLAKELYAVAPALTDNQLRLYVRAFNNLPDVAATRAQYINAALTLSSELGRIVGSKRSLRDVMNGITKQTPSRGGMMTTTLYGPSDLYDGYKLLAETPVATGAVRFASHLLANDPAYANIKASDEDVVEDIVIPALPRALAQGLAMKGDVPGALSWLEDALLSGNWGGGNALMANLGEFRKTGRLSALRDVKTGGRSLGRAQNAAGTVIAVFMLGEGVSSALEGNFKDAIEKLALGGPQAFNGLHDGIATIRSLIRSGSAGPGNELFTKVAQISGSIGAGVGVVLTIMAVPGHLAELASTSGKITFAADLLAIAGGVASIALPAASLGPIVTVVAIGVYVLAAFISDNEESSQRRKDEETCLRKMGFSAELTDTLVHASSTIMRTLDKDLKLPPLTIQWIARTYPPLIKADEGVPIRFNGLKVAKDIFKLDGVELAALLRASVGQADDRTEMARLLGFLRVLEFDLGWNGGLDPQEALDWLEKKSEKDPIIDGSPSAPYIKAGLKNARNHLVPTCKQLTHKACN